MVVTKDCGIASFIKRGQNGVLIDWHEKQRPVAGGERIPFVNWLPESWKQAMLEWGAQMTRIESLPDLRIKAGDVELVLTPSMYVM